MNDFNQNTTTIRVTAPCDLYGSNARKLNLAIRGCDGVIQIEKPDESRSCRASSLLGLLSLGVRRGETFHLIAKESCGACPHLAGLLTCLAQ